MSMAEMAIKQEKERIGERVLKRIDLIPLCL